MSKVFAIARAEYLESVRSKAFLVGLLAMPILMGGGILFQVLVGDQVDLRDRNCAVVDPTGELWPVLLAAAEERNQNAIWDPADEEGGEPEQLRPKFLLERFEPAGDGRPDIELSQRVEDGELQGFILIDEGVFGESPGERPLAYHTAEPTFTELSRWLDGVINETLTQRRFDQEGLDQAVAEKLSRRVPLSTWGLVAKRSDGSVDEAERENKLRTFGIPFAGMMLLFMMVMTSAPQLMNQVLEEKMQRISEVLVSAVTPFQLMMGKLFGSVAVTLTLAGVYLGGIFWATHHWGVSDFVPPSTYAWIIVLMIFAMLMYGSLFSALGSACSELRDAQSMMMPAMIVILIPLFAMSAVIESPNGGIAVALTYFPTATPMMLLIRVLAPPGPPLIEIVAAMLMCIVTTVALVWASSKIFRVGVLSQGQSPTFRKLLGWVLTP